MLKGVLIFSYKDPDGFGEDCENAGARLFLATAIKNWSMEAREHKAGRLVVHFRLSHQDSNQFQGMNPVKPGIFLKAPLKVKANTVRQWASVQLSAFIIRLKRIF